MAGNKELNKKIFYRGLMVNFSSSTKYPTVWDGNKNVLLHRLVWEDSYGKIPDGYEIHHKNKNRRDFRLENLELVEKKEHAKRHAIENGLGKSNKGRRKVYQSGCIPIKRSVILFKEDCEVVFETVSDAAKFLNARASNVSRVARGYRKTLRGWCVKYATC